MGAIRAALSESSMSGEIPIGGVLDILREIEARRITGSIAFTAGGETGLVEVIGGQIALDQEPRRDGSDPVEAMLALRGGSFVVHQRLPPLPVSAGDDGHRTGSLAVHVPADLMNYCEQAGLTGTLQLKNAGQLVELVYEAGELLAIRIDGREGADLSHVFSWDEGRFDIRVGREVRSLLPEGLVAQGGEDDLEAREPTTQFVRPRKDDTGKHFLKVFEVALTDIVATREKARPAKRTSPPRAPIPSVRPPALSTPKKRKREATVRIVYLAGDDESALAAIDHATRYASSSATNEEVVVESTPFARAPSDPKAKAAATRAAPSKNEAPKKDMSPARSAESALVSTKVPVPEDDDEGAEAGGDEAEGEEAGGVEESPAGEDGPVPANALAAPSQGATLGWWVAVVVLVLVLLAVLAQLFPTSAP